MLHCAYIRYRENLPESKTTFAAADGFTMQGIPVVPFRGFGDLDDLHAKGELRPDTIVCGYVGDVHKALELLGRPIPPPLDYPEHLEWMYGRSIRKTTLGEVRASIKPVFVKPIRQKVFTGLVWDPADPLPRIKLAAVEDEEPCFASDLVEFRSEWRCYIRNHEVIGVKHYKGDWSLAPNREIVEAAVRGGERAKMPRAYALDVGVDGEGGTSLVECNDFSALGDYGLPSILYARAIESRWFEMMGM